MLLTVVICFLVVPVLFSEARPKPDTRDKPDTTPAQDYMLKYGYLYPGELITETRFAQGLQQFQEMAGIPQTGEFDEDTQAAMLWPRCGNTDYEVLRIETKRKKRYIPQGSTWNKRELTYRVTRYPERISTRAIDREIERSFKLWSKVCNLKFKRVWTSNMDIEVKFVRRSHGDNSPFDGPAGVLAHAFFPQYGGDMHFDDEENYQINTKTGVDIHTVATHEIGHSIGLSHSQVREAMMAPFYRGYKPNMRLHNDDIQGCRAMYGSPVNETTTTTTDRPTTSPTTPPSTTVTTSRPTSTRRAPREKEPLDPCLLPKLDAAVFMDTSDYMTYFFSGDKYWKLNDLTMENGYPRYITPDWGLPNNLDAAIAAMDWRGTIYFFKDKRYWRFQGERMARGYPKIINEDGFFGLPYGLDAAFVWSGNMQPYFIKGGLYYRLQPSGNGLMESSRVDPNYPRRVQNWRGIPNPPDAALQWINGRTYFFKDKRYYRFNDRKFETDTSYPRDTAYWWLQCKGGLRAAGTLDDFELVDDYIK